MASGAINELTSIQNPYVDKKGIDMHTKHLPLILFLMAFLSACGGSNNAPVAPVPPLIVTVTSVSVTPRSTLLARQDDNHQLSVELFDADGATVDKPVTWTSSDTNIVTADAEGLLTSMGTVGSATVTAEVDGVESEPVLVFVVLPVINSQFINDDQLVPTEVDFEISEVADEFYTMEEQTDGSYLFTLRPGIPVAEPVGSSVPGGSSMQKTTSALASVGRGVIGTVANPHHPFNCTFTGPSFDSAGNQVLTIAGMSPSILFERDLSMPPPVYDSDNGGLEKLTLQARVKGTFTVQYLGSHQYLGSEQTTIFGVREKTSGNELFRKTLCCIDTNRVIKSGESTVAISPV